MESLSELLRIAERRGTVNRRWFGAYVGALTSLPLLGRESCLVARPNFSSDPFTLGVASGDPDWNSVVLWTRLCLSPFKRVVVCLVKRWK